jgi:hypothetical protein
VIAFVPCLEEDFPIVDAAGASAGRLYHVTRGLTVDTKRISSLPTLGPGLLAVNGYSHVRDALSHPEQRGSVLSLFKVRVVM